MNILGPDRDIEQCARFRYRNFYLGEKSVFAKWTLRPEPDWWVAYAA